jgi:hypothetical protein
LKSAPDIKWTLALIGAVFLCCGVKAQESYTLTGAKTPKHYFNTIIVLDAYRKPEKAIKDTSEFISRKLKNYGVKQTDLSFCTPLMTRDYTDSNVISNTHLLLTGNYVALRPGFDGISDHRLVKFGIGVRYIYNTGKKGVWFIDVAPFATWDAANRSDRYRRLASTIVYSHNVNDRFNWRLGVTKSFLWGNRFYWPFIGLRFGRLDKVNLSIQFPRFINLAIPMGSKVILSIYSKAQGGMYNFSNHDSLYYKKQDATFNFTRYEINTGLRLDVRIGTIFSFYVATGLSTRNNITFYSERANKNRPRSPYRTYFYSENTVPTGYLNLGLVFKFGKTKSYFNNRNLYDAMNMNSTLDGNGNAQIPLTPRQRSEANLESVRDLIDYNDF